MAVQCAKIIEDVSAEIIHLVRRRELIGHHDRIHTGAVSGTDAVVGILDGIGGRRVCAELFTGKQIDIRLRFAALQLVAAHNDREIREQTGFCELGLDRGLA